MTTDRPSTLFNRTCCYFVGMLTSLSAARWWTYD